MRVNLIEQEKRAFIFSYLRVGIIISIFILFFIIAFTHFYFVVERNILQNEIKNIEDQMAIYIPKEEEYHRYEALIEEIKSTPTIPNYIWDGPIEAMGYITPLRGVIDNFSLRNRSLNITGRTKIAEELREFTINLTESPYFDNVNLETLQKQEEVSFTITANLIEEGSE